MKTSHPYVTAAAVLLLIFAGVMFTPQQPQPAHTFIDKIALPPVDKIGSVNNNLRYAYAVGSEVGNPETLQAIMLQETGGSKLAGVGNRNAPVGRRSYGLMQVQVVAARSILERYKHVRTKYFTGRSYRSIVDEEIIALLLTNDEANIRIAAHHFNLYLKISDGNWEKAVAAYNMGIGAVQNVSNYEEVAYVIEIKHKMEKVRLFNEQHKRS